MKNTGGVSYGSPDPYVEFSAKGDLGKGLLRLGAWDASSSSSSKEEKEEAATLLPPGKEEEEGGEEDGPGRP